MPNRVENLGIRVQAFNRLALPVVLNQIESAQLEQYFMVKIIENPQQLKEFIRKSEKGLLLYSFMTPQLPQVLKEISWINRYKKAALKTLAGGPHTCGDPESSLKMGFDYAFCGAAEMGLGSVVQDYLKGKIRLYFHEEGPSSQRTYNKSFEGPDELDGQIGQILAENEPVKSAFSVGFLLPALARPTASVSGVAVWFFFFSSICLSMLRACFIVR